jgi:hypothetical protein
LNDGLDLELNEIDLESLRLVFGSASPEDLTKRKAHEIRELWMEKTQSPSMKTKLVRMPRFLLDPKNKDHIAPHAVALQLLLRRKGQNKSNGDGLYMRVPRSEEANPQNTTEGRNVLQHQSNMDRTNPNTLDHQRSSAMNFGIVLHALLMLVAIGTLACQFVLEVMGGAGAIWGCAELVRLRKGGRTDPSFNIFSWVALGVGICCLVRFLLVHPFFASTTDPSFAEKHKLHKLLLVDGNRSRLSVLVAMARVVASDPVLFLHPAKGHAFVGCCGCYCVYCGNQWPSSFDHSSDSNSNQIRSNEDSCFSPETIGKSSPQRSTWELSDDEFDECEFENAV